MMQPAAFTTCSNSFVQSVYGGLVDQDPEVAELFVRESRRQAETIELIASENHVSTAVMQAMGSWLTNKYAEGYPGRRYYGGCEHHDAIENLAIERAKKLFGCEFANVQPHSGANANMAACMALLKPGDTILSLPINAGGHLSHGLASNFSGRFYKIHHYDLDPQTETIDFDRVRGAALKAKPALIICGFSAYPRTVDFQSFREIADEVGAKLMADIAHIAGLVASGVHPSPFPHAHIVTSTTHKTLRGPRGGLILTNDPKLAKRLNRALFPGSQGGPLMHVVAAKAVAFAEALRPSFRDYAERVVANAKAMASELRELGYRLCSGGADNHLVLVDLRARDSELTGARAECRLESVGIIVNKNGVPNDPRKPMVTSGLRLGTSAITTRGMGVDTVRAIVRLMDETLAIDATAEGIARVRREVRQICDDHPLPH